MKLHAVELKERKRKLRKILYAWTLRNLAIIKYVKWFRDMKLKKQRKKKTLEI